MEQFDPWPPPLVDNDLQLPSLSFMRGKRFRLQTERQTDRQRDRQTDTIQSREQGSHATAWFLDVPWETIIRTHGWLRFVPLSMENGTRPNQPWVSNDVRNWYHLATVLQLGITVFNATCTWTCRFRKCVILHV